MMTRLIALTIFLALAAPVIGAEQRLPGAVIVDAASFIDRMVKGDTISQAQQSSGSWLFNNLAINLNSPEELITTVDVPAEGNYHLFVRSQGSGNASFKVAVLGQYTEGTLGNGPLSWKDAGEFYLPKSLVDVRITSISPGASFDVMVLSPDANLKDTDLWPCQFPADVVMLKDYNIPRAASVKFGDLNGDGLMDFVVITPNYSAYAYDNGGSELWHWEAPQAGSADRSNAVAPGSVWDFDQDGRADLVHWRMIDGKEWLCIADGATGAVKYKVEWPTKPLPHPYANFCTAIARLKEGYPDGLIVYSDSGDSQTINAYGPKLNLLWSHQESRQKDYFGHAIFPIDTNGDGVSELFFSHLCLDAQGKVIWSDLDKYADSQNTTTSLRFADLNGDGGLEMVAAQGALGMAAYRADSGDTLWKATAIDSEKVEIGHFLDNAPAPQVVTSITTRMEQANGQAVAQSSLRWFGPAGRPLDAWPPNPLNVTPEFVKGDWRGDGTIKLFWHRFMLNPDGKGTLYFPEEVIHMFDFTGNGAEQVVCLDNNAGILRIYGCKDLRGRYIKRDADYLLNVVANHSHF